MKRNITIAEAGALALIGAFLLAGCSTADSPVSADNNPDGYTVIARVAPPEFLRTEATRTSWNTPTEVSYSIDSQGNLSKPVHEDSAKDRLTIGTRHAGGMEIVLGYSEGRDMYSMHENGMMNTRHPDPGAHHYMVRIFNDSTFNGGQIRMPLPVSDVTLTAITDADTGVYNLEPVMGAHGYRYQANTDLPYGTYTFRVEVSAPDFYRTAETQNFWTTSTEVAFPAFILDSTSIPAQVGTRTILNDDDSLEFTLAAQAPEEFGAMGMQWTPLSGNETVNFALEISDPANNVEQMPLYNAPVQLIVQNNQTGETETKTLEPIYGPHGFYYGENYMTEMMGDDMHGSGGGHDNGNSGMGMGGM